MKKLVHVVFVNLVIANSLSGALVLADTPAKDGKTTSATSSKSTTTSKSNSAATKTVSKSAATKPDSKSSPSKPDSKSTAIKPAAATNLTGTWNIKFTESPTTKTHIMAVKVVQKGNTFTATGVDQYGDVTLEGNVVPPEKITFKRTYKGLQVNPSAQFDGTFSPAKEFTPVVAKGKWSAQPFADKSLKPKATSNSGDWEANIFTGPAINK